MLIHQPTLTAKPRLVGPPRGVPGLGPVGTLLLNGTKRTWPRINPKPGRDTLAGVPAVMLDRPVTVWRLYLVRNWFTLLLNVLRSESTCVNPVAFGAGRVNTIYPTFTANPGDTAVETTVGGTMPKNPGVPPGPTFTANVGLSGPPIEPTALVA